MHPFDDELNRRLAGLREQNLFRELRRVDSAQGPHIEINGKKFLNFASNDYLGFADHPALKEAAMKAVDKFGAGAGAARLTSGSLSPFHELEESLAEFKKTKAALTFSTGYAAAAGTITSLVGKGDVIIIDKLVHACIVDAARLSGAKLRIFDHNDVNDLEKILAWADEVKAEGGRRKAKILVVTESIFSMDGDAAPLCEIVALKEKYGAWLMVDEAHATGLYGENRRGLAEELGVSNRIEIQMGTLGKALGASGGYICGSRPLIDLLINQARSFIFSTAPVPAAAAAATAGVKLVQSADGLAACKRTWMLVAGMKRAMETGGPMPANVRGAIVPYMVGDESQAVELSRRLFAAGFFVPAIRFPTVPRGKARLRFSVTARHDLQDVRNAVKWLGKLQP